MHVLFDTNVVLDVLLEREPWVAQSSAAWQAKDDDKIAGYITACTLTDIFYIARRMADLPKAHEAIRVCLDTFEICPVDYRTLREAEALPGSDFEDNLQIACASLMLLDVILTRDKAGFEQAPVAVMTPDELLQQLREAQIQTEE